MAVSGIAARMLTLGAATLALAACGAEAPEPAEATLAVYVSAPLTGPARAEGQAVADGARAALAEAGGEAGGFAVEAHYLDAAGRNETSWDPVIAAANARAAAEDSTTIAYIGELESGATRSSRPITSAAGILHVAPNPGDPYERGHDAMRKVLAAIERAEDPADRASVIAAEDALSGG